MPIKWPVVYWRIWQDAEQANERTTVHSVDFVNAPLSMTAKTYVRTINELGNAL